jgi:hypothetical protein
VGQRSRPFQPGDTGIQSAFLANEEVDIETTYALYHLDHRTGVPGKTITSEPEFKKQVGGILIEAVPAYNIIKEKE